MSIPLADVPGKWGQSLAKIITVSALKSGPRYFETYNSRTPQSSQDFSLEQGESHSKWGLSPDPTDGLPWYKPASPGSPLHFRAPKAPREQAVEFSPGQQGARPLEFLLLLCDTGAIVPSSSSELDANFTDQPPISLFNSHFHVGLKQCTDFRKGCVSTHTFRQYDNNWTVCSSTARSILSCLSLVH